MFFGLLVLSLFLIFVPLGPSLNDVTDLGGREYLPNGDVTPLAHLVKNLKKWVISFMDVNKNENFCFLILAHYVKSWRKVNILYHHTGTANAGIMDFVGGGHHHHRTASDTASGTSSTSGKPGTQLVNTYLECSKNLLKSAIWKNKIIWKGCNFVAPIWIIYPMALVFFVIF